MTGRKYFSQRNEEVHNSKLDLTELKRIFVRIYKEYENRNYFIKAFGYMIKDVHHRGFVCDDNKVEDINDYILRKIRKRNLWPIEEKIVNYSEDDLFDIIEFVYDLIVKPPWIYDPTRKVDPLLHISPYLETLTLLNDLSPGEGFSKIAGQNEFKTELNLLLCDYGEGYQLSDNGEIQLLGNKDLQFLFSEDIPEVGDNVLDEKIRAAINQFRHHQSNDEQKMQAVRNLADVLESLRPTMKKMQISKDENELFNIANNFGIRHFRQNQKIDYDKSVFLTWIFTCFLSTIYLIVRLKNIKDI